MKEFLKKTWSLIVKFFKWLFEKISTIVKKFKYDLGFVSKGIDGENTPENKYLMVFPTIFTHIFKDTFEIGIVWFGFGIKLIIVKK